MAEILTSYKYLVMNHVICFLRSMQTFSVPSYRIHQDYIWYGFCTRASLLFEEMLVQM
jgi:hypothetical protein